MLHSCPQCGGQLYLIGQLAYRDHYRCRSCGWDVSMECPEMSTREWIEREADRQEREAMRRRGGRPPCIPVY